MIAFLYLIVIIVGLVLILKADNFKNKLIADIMVTLGIMIFTFTLLLFIMKLFY